MKILETERTILREINENDAEFILDLLNQPSFIKYIGDKNVKTVEKAEEVIENVYRKGYRDFGYGLYIVELKTDKTPMGFCGFVRRKGLPAADIGFAFLPQFEKKGYAFETASAVLRYGKEKLNFLRVFAITTQKNESSIKLLKKLGFAFDKLVKIPGEEQKLNLFSRTLFKL